MRSRNRALVVMGLLLLLWSILALEIAWRVGYGPVASPSDRHARFEADISWE